MRSCQNQFRRKHRVEESNAKKFNLNFGSTSLQAGPRNSTALVLSAAFFISAAIDFSVSGPGATITPIIEAALAIISLAYWGIAQPREPMSTRPLGITILAVENLIGGLILGLAGILLLLLPVLGIIGAGAVVVGVGLVYLGRGLWNGREWALTVETVVTVIAIISGFAAVAFHQGNPTLAIFQLWYLRRPNVEEFFQDTTTMRSSSLKQPVSRTEKTCPVCGAPKQGRTASCSNCGIRIFSSSDGIPFAGATESENIVRLKLERLQEELQKMDRIKQEGRVPDPSIFEKAYSERESENRRLKAKLETITSTTSAS